MEQFLPLWLFVAPLVFAIVSWIRNPGLGKLTLA